MFSSWLTLISSIVQIRERIARLCAWKQAGNGSDSWLDSLPELSGPDNAAFSSTCFQQALRNLQIDPDSSFASCTAANRTRPSLRTASLVIDPNLSYLACMGVQPVLQDPHSRRPRSERYPFEIRKCCVACHLSLAEDSRVVHE